MKHIKIILFAILGLISCNISYGATLDSDGKPVVYLRGEVTNWGVSEAYRFSRQGNTYTLSIGAANPIEGQFKIADDNWEKVDLGGDSKDIYVNENLTLKLRRRGENLHTNGIYNGEISFDLTDGDFCEVDFMIGEQPTGAQKYISGTLPVMYINVYKDATHKSFNDEVINYNLDHKNYFTEAEYWLDINGCEWMEQNGAKSVGSAEDPLPLQIKARGNWTRIGFSKKPFKLKLDKKQDLLGLTPEKSKHYALLAHADDTNGYLRNFTAFNLGERIGLPWTPGMQPVELVINGDYRGLYFLTESVRVGDGRIDIEELDDNETDSSLISGGYVVELDNYDEDNQIRMEELSWVNGQHLDLLRVSWDTPEEYSQIQKRFITDQFSAINSMIGRNSDDTWSYLDLDDAARYYLVNEIVSHTESYHGSTYLYRNRGEGEKWHFSPLWDAGNAFRGHTDQFFYDCDPFGNTWIPSLRENRMFNDKVKATWLWFMQKEYSGLEDDMSVYAERLKDAAKCDKKRWNAEPCPPNGQGVADNSDMDGKLKEVKTHLHAKIEWLKKQFGDYLSGNYDEPTRDLTPAAPLPDYASAGIEEITDYDNESAVTFYNLQGIRVINPTPGNIYIVHKEGRRFKAVYR